MILLDSDTLTLYFAGHPLVTAKVQAAPEAPATTLVTRIEILRGRFDSVLKAKDGEQLLRAEERLAIAESSLARFRIVAFDNAIAAYFDRMVKHSRLKKVGRADLLIACIALAHRATLITRNVRHFQQVQGLRVENWAD